MTERSPTTERRKPSLARRLLWTLLAIVLIAGGAAGSFYRPDIPQEEMRERWADASSRFVEILGSEVHLRDEAPPDRPDAPVLVLLHGTASSLHTWDAWAQRLGSTYRIVRWDLQGFGLTGPNPEADYTVDRQIRVGEEILERLGIESATIGGNSLGGAIAWRWALAHPERVDGLILVDAAGYPVSALRAGGAQVPEPARNALSLGSMPVVKDIITKITPRFVIENALEEVYGDPERVDPLLVQRHYEMLLAEGNREALRTALAQRRETPPSQRDLWREIPQIEQPALILWGARDTWIPLAAGERFHRDLPNSQLIVYPEAGHVPMEEVPQESARDVEAWMS